MQERLQKLGLSPKEAQIYMASLKLGEASPVSTIAKVAGINRTTAYDVLQTLVERGLIITSKSKKFISYQAQPPEKLVNHLKEEAKKFERMAEEANEILPELNTHYRAMTGRPRVYFYEGEEGLIRVYGDAHIKRGNPCLRVSSCESREYSLVFSRVLQAKNRKKHSYSCHLS